MSFAAYNAMKKDMAAYRGRLIPVTAAEAIDGQRLYVSDRNANYYLGVNGSEERIMLSLSDACGWLLLHGEPQRADTQLFVESLTLALTGATR